MDFLPRLFDTEGGDWPGLSYNFVIKTQPGLSSLLYSIHSMVLESQKYRSQIKPKFLKCIKMFFRAQRQLQQ